MCSSINFLQFVLNYLSASFMYHSTLVSLLETESQRECKSYSMSEKNLSGVAIGEMNCVVRDASQHLVFYLLCVCCY